MNRIWAALAAFALTLGLLVGVPVSTAGTTAQGVSVTALGQPVDTAAAAGSLYYRGGGGASMYVLYNRLGFDWYRLYSGRSTFQAVQWKPMPGFAAIWFQEGIERYHTARCYHGIGRCDGVPLYGDVIITNVYRMS